MSTALPWVPELWLPRAWQRSRVERLLKQLRHRAPGDDRELERVVALGHRAWERPPMEVVAPTMLLAARWADAGRLHDAADLCDRAARVAAWQVPAGHPTPALATAHRARTLARANEHDQAEASIRTALGAMQRATREERDPVGRATLLFGSADVARHAGEFERAETRLTEALRQLGEPSPSSDSAPYRHGGVPPRERQHDDEESNHAGRLAADLVLRLGALALVRHDLARARVVFGHVSRRYGSSHPAAALWAELGLCGADLAEDDVEAATSRLATIEKRLDALPAIRLDLAGQLALIRADVRVENGDGEGAERTLLDLLGVPPVGAAQRVEALWRLARAVVHQGTARAGEAAEIAGEAVETARRAGLDPDLRSRALFELGRALLEVGEDDTAREALDQAREIARRRHGPEHPRTRPLAQALRTGRDL